METVDTRVAVVTGASMGFGLALTGALVADGWTVVGDARREADLIAAFRDIGPAAVAVPGDVADPVHRAHLVAAARDRGGLDLLVNNASILGPSPQPPLVDYPLDVLREVYDVNVLAPLALAQLCLPLLDERSGAIVNVTSDAAVEGYAGWGGYGSSKAALEQWSNVLAAEHAAVRVYWFDPGDMRTRMHQEAFPDDDISDRPPPEHSVPPLLHVLANRLPSGRYAARDLRVAP